MNEKKACPMALGLMVFSECALCCASDNGLAKECANTAAAKIAGDYDRMNTRRKKRKRS